MSRSKIPGRVVERVEVLGDHLAVVTVAGVPRRTHGGRLAEDLRDADSRSHDDAFDPDSWVVIHMGLTLGATSDGPISDGPIGGGGTRDGG